MHIPFSRFALVLLIAPTFLPVVHAAGPAKADYPTRPVRFIVGQTSGGNADFIARVIAGELSKRFGQQFVVENRGGASGMIAAELAVRAPPDGQTLLLTASSFTVNPSLYSKMPYDPLVDLAPITRPALAPNILVVNPALSVRTVKDLIDLARAKPGQLNFGSSGQGGSPHLAGEMFNLMAGVDMRHVPYKGAPASLTDLIAGQIQLSFASMPSVIMHVRSGRLRGVAVTTLTRSPLAPELPTVAESGLPGFETSAWQGIFAPRYTPQPLILLLNGEITRIVNLPDIKKQLAAEGAEPVANTPEEFAKWLRADIARWAKVVKAANVRVE
jgi:tripartite-type tricarboxylate transporter receptor subunit TctC